MVLVVIWSAVNVQCLLGSLVVGFDNGQCQVEVRLLSPRSIQAFRIPGVLRVDYSVAGILLF